MTIFQPRASRNASSSRRTLVLRSQSTCAGNIDKEDWLGLEVGERDRLGRLLDLDRRGGGMSSVEGQRRAQGGRRTHGEIVE